MILKGSPGRGLAGDVQSCASTDSRQSSKSLSACQNSVLANKAMARVNLISVEIRIAFVDSVSKTVAEYNWPRRIVAEQTIE